MATTYTNSANNGQDSFGGLTIERPGPVTRAVNAVAGSALDNSRVVGEAVENLTNVAANMEQTVVATASQVKTTIQEASVKSSSVLDEAKKFLKEARDTVSKLGDKTADTLDGVKASVVDHVAVIACSVAGVIRSGTDDPVMVGLWVTNIVSHFSGLSWAGGKAKDVGKMLQNKWTDRKVAPSPACESCSGGSYCDLAKNTWLQVHKKLHPEHDEDLCTCLSVTAVQKFCPKWSGKAEAATNLIEDLYTSVRTCMGLEEYSPKSLGTLKCFNELTKTVVTLGSVFKFILHMLQELSEMIATKIFGTSFAWTNSSAAKQEHDEFCERVRELAAHPKHILDSHRLKTIVHVDELLEMGQRVRDNIHSAERILGPNSRFSKAYDVLVGLKKRILVSESTYGSRPMPVGALFFGFAKCGKTELAKQFIKDGLAVLRKKGVQMPEMENYIYEKNVDMEFWDAYESQPALMLTDIFKSEDPKECDIERALWHLYNDTSVFILNMSHLEDKGATPFKVQMVVGTTNRWPQKVEDVTVGKRPVKAQNETDAEDAAYYGVNGQQGNANIVIKRPSDSALRDYSATARRVQIYAEVRFNPNWCDQQRQLIPDKIPGYVKRVQLGTKVFYVGAWQIRMWNPATEAPLEPNVWMDYDTFLLNVATPILERSAEQRSLYEKDMQERSATFTFKPLQPILTFPNPLEKLKEFLGKTGSLSWSGQAQGELAKAWKNNGFKHHKNRVDVALGMSLGKPMDRTWGKQHGISKEDMDDIDAVVQAEETEKRFGTALSLLLVSDLKITNDWYEEAHLSMIGRFLHTHPHLSMFLKVVVVGALGGAALLGLGSLAGLVFGSNPIEKGISAVVTGVRTRAQSVKKALMDKLSSVPDVEFEDFENADINLDMQSLTDKSKKKVLQLKTALPQLTVFTGNTQAAQWAPYKNNMVRVRSGGVSMYGFMLSGELLYFPAHLVLLSGTPDIEVKYLDGTEAPKFSKITVAEDHGFAVADKPLVGCKSYVKRLLNWSDYAGNVFDGFGRINEHSEWEWIPFGTITHNASYKAENGLSFDNATGIVVQARGSDGMCGLPYLSFNPRRADRTIVGFHVAGDPNTETSFIRLLPHELVLKVLAHYGMAAQGRVYPPRVEVVGEVAPTGSNGRTCIVPSAIQKVTEETMLTGPALLHVKGNIDPNQKLLEKYAATQFNNEFYAEIRQDFVDSINDTLNRIPMCPHVRMPTREEALSGIPTWKSLGPAVLTSTVGYHWANRGFKSRKQMVDGVGFDMKLKPALVEEFWEEKRMSIYKWFLKDERRSVEKVRAGATRKIAASEFDAYIKVRRVLAPLVELIVCQGSQSEFAIGVDPHSRMWDHAYNWLTRDGRDVDGLFRDVSSYDFCHGDLPQSDIFRCIALFYLMVGVVKTDQEVDYVYNTLMAHGPLSLIVLDSTLLKIKDEWKSGNGGTALIVSLLTIGWSKSAYLYAARSMVPQLAHLKAFHDHSRLKALGDDVWQTVSQGIRDWYNNHAIRDFMAKLGYTVTSANKLSELLPYEPVKEGTFLKRHIVKHNQTVFAPMEMDAIHDIPYWMTRGLDPRDATLDNVHVAFFEYSVHIAANTKWAGEAKAAIQRLIGECTEVGIHARPISDFFRYYVTVRKFRYCKFENPDFESLYNGTDIALQPKPLQNLLLPGVEEYLRTEKEIPLTLPDLKPWVGKPQSATTATGIDTPAKDATSVTGGTAKIEEAVVVEQGEKVESVSLLSFPNEATPSLERFYEVLQFNVSSSSSGPRLASVSPWYALLQEDQIQKMLSYKTHFRSDVECMWVVSGATNSQGRLYWYWTPMDNGTDFFGRGRYPCGSTTTDDTSTAVALGCRHKGLISLCAGPSPVFELPFVYMNLFINPNTDCWISENQLGVLTVGVMNGLEFQGAGTSVSVQLFARFKNPQVQGNILSATNAYSDLVGYPFFKGKAQSSILGSMAGAALMSGAMAGRQSAERSLSAGIGDVSATVRGKVAGPLDEAVVQSNEAVRAISGATLAASNIISLFGRDKPVDLTPTVRTTYDPSCGVHQGTGLDYYPTVSQSQAARLKGAGILVKDEGSKGMFSDLLRDWEYWGSISFTSSTAINTVLGVIPVTPCLQANLASSNFQGWPNGRNLLSSSFDYWAGGMEYFIDVNIPAQSIVKIGAAWTPECYASLPLSTITNPTDVFSMTADCRGDSSLQFSVQYANYSPMLDVEDYDNAIAVSDGTDVTMRNGYIILYISNPLSNSQPATGVSHGFLNIFSRCSEDMEFSGETGFFKYPSSAINSGGMAQRQARGPGVNPRFRGKVQAAVDLSVLNTSGSVPLNPGTAVKTSDFVVSERCFSLYDIAHRGTFSQGLGYNTDSYFATVDPFTAVESHQLASSGGAPAYSSTGIVLPTLCYKYVRGGFWFATQPTEGNAPYLGGMAGQGFAGPSYGDSGCPPLNLPGQGMSGYSIPYRSRYLVYDSSFTADSGYNPAPAFFLNTVDGSSFDTLLYWVGGRDDLTFHWKIGPMQWATPSARAVTALESHVGKRRITKFSSSVSGEAIVPLHSSTSSSAVALKK